jgi:hypothetical protein
MGILRGTSSCLTTGVAELILNRRSKVGLTLASEEQTQAKRDDDASNENAAVQEIRTMVRPSILIIVIEIIGHVAIICHRAILRIRSLL